MGLCPKKFIMYNVELDWTIVDRISFAPANTVGLEQYMRDEFHMDLVTVRYQGPQHPNYPATGCGGQWLQSPSRGRRGHLCQGVHV